ncbi:hypothetical protein V6Z11_A06G116800 [Gossypium hirsutum]
MSHDHPLPHEAENTCLYPLPAHQKGVPTKVLLERCLSLTSNMQVETPKSASFTIPLLSSSMIPGCNAN